MLLAELEIRHSRTVAPTRRIALGELYLPVEPAPGYGGLLLAGIVGGFAPKLDAEVRDDLDVLIDDLERNRRIPQPRLRHRFQTDVVGLDRSRHRLIGHGESLHLQLDDHGFPLPQVLGAVYAASKLTFSARAGVFRLLWRALRWEAGVPGLLEYLSGDDAAFRRRRGTVLDASWALSVMGFSADGPPPRSDVIRRFRTLIRDAHPDHGADIEEAGRIISDLTEAKRILLAAI